jgi:hypothetical protein
MGEPVSGLTPFALRSVRSPYWLLATALNPPCGKAQGGIRTNAPCKCISACRDLAQAFSEAEKSPLEGTRVPLHSRVPTRPEAVCDE